MRPWISGEFCRKINPVIISTAGVRHCRDGLKPHIPAFAVTTAFSDHLSHKLHSEYTLIAHINCYYGDKEEGGGNKVKTSIDKQV